MKFALLLALLVGGASALHLSESSGPLEPETSGFKSPLGDDNLPRDVEISRPEAEECPPGEELISLEEEEGSGSDDTSGVEGAVSGQDMADEDFQCPKEEDTISLKGNPGCKTCRFLLVRQFLKFDSAQSVCRRCYRGNLASIHSFSINFQIQASLRALNQAQVWIGGRIRGLGPCKRLQWVDGSSWNFAYWASGQPRCGIGRCVTMCTRGGHWRRSLCIKRRPFICSY